MRGQQPSCGRARLGIVAGIIALVVYFATRDGSGPRSILDVAFTRVTDVYIAPVGDAQAGRVLKAATWNVAAINNNPFEYWVSDGGEQYESLVKGFAKVVESPTDQDDLLVSDVFTREMVETLFAEMKDAGWKRLDSVRKRYDEDISKRRIISDFLRDKMIGKKRLISMFDRLTNTVTTASGEVVYRPSPVNCYEGSLLKVKVWWKEWILFVFRTRLLLPGRNDNPPVEKLVRETLIPITRAKYPSVTEEESLMSIPLQTLHGAIFDTILAYTLNNLNTEWGAVRGQMCAALNKGKAQRTVDILSLVYSDSDVIFLQEVGSSLVERLKKSSLAAKFTILVPQKFDRDRNQNSIILARNDVWDHFEEVTDAVLASETKRLGGVANGDLFATAATHKPTGAFFLLGSFHGDTNGMLTIPVVDAMHSTAGNRRLLFGLDANTHEKGDVSRQSVTAFGQFFVSKDLTSCWGENPNPQNYTTFHARTHLQPQLNKAVGLEQRHAKGDRSPKDFLLFSRPYMSLRRTTKDNTGAGRYLEDTVFPSLKFPSDHGIVSSVIVLR